MFKPQKLIWSSTNVWETCMTHITFWLQNSWYLNEGRIYFTVVPCRISLHTLLIYTFINGGTFYSSGCYCGNRVPSSSISHAQKCRWNLSWQLEVRSCKKIDELLYQEKEHTCRRSISSSERPDRWEIIQRNTFPCATRSTLRPSFKRGSIVELKNPTVLPYVSCKVIISHLLRVYLTIDITFIELQIKNN